MLIKSMDKKKIHEEFQYVIDIIILADFIFMFNTKYIFITNIIINEAIIFVETYKFEN